MNRDRTKKMMLKIADACRQSGYTLELTRKGGTMLSNDPGYWQRRAEEARNLAKQMHDEQNKRMMLKIATAYDGLAIKAATPSVT